jgi:hypothetical protein
VCASLLEECGNFTRPSTRDRFGDLKVQNLDAPQKAVHAIYRLLEPVIDILLGDDVFAVLLLGRDKSMLRLS